MLEKCVLNSYLILLFRRKIPTFSYFLMKISTFSYFFDLSYYLTPCFVFHNIDRITFFEGFSCRDFRMSRTPFAQMKLDFDKFMSSPEASMDKFMSSPEASMDTSTYFLKPDPAKPKPSTILKG